MYVVLLLPLLNQLLSQDGDAELVLLAGARKELAYLDQFGSRRVSYKGLRRDCHHNEKQEQSDQAKNLISLHRHSCQTMTPSPLSAFATPTSTSTISRFREMIPVAYYGFAACWTDSTLLSYPSSSTPVCPMTSRTKRTRSLEV